MRKSNPNRAYLRDIKMSPVKKCFLCEKLLADRGLPNNSGLCSGCSNDCRNGQFGRIKRNINKKIEKAIKDCSQSHGKVTE